MHRADAHQREGGERRHADDFADGGLRAHRRRHLVRGGEQRRGHEIEPRVEDVAPAVGQIIGNAARQRDAGDGVLHHRRQMVQRSAERVAVADVDAGVFAEAVGDVHRARAGDGFVELPLLLGLRNDEDVVQMIFLHQLAALLHHPHAVRPEAELDDAALPGSVQQLDDTHAADGEPVGDGLLGHIFKVIIPCGLDHQRILVMNGVIHGCSVSHRKTMKQISKCKTKVHIKSIAPNKADVNSFAK